MDLTKLGKKKSDTISIRLYVCRENEERACRHTSIFFPCMINLTEESGPSHDIRIATEVPRLLLGATTIHLSLSDELKKADFSKDMEKDLNFLYDLKKLAEPSLQKIEELEKEDGDDDRG